MQCEQSDRCSGPEMSSPEENSEARRSNGRRKALSQVVFPEAGRGMGGRGEGGGGGRGVEGDGDDAGTGSQFSASHELLSPLVSPPKQQTRSCHMLSRSYLHSRNFPDRIELFPDMVVSTDYQPKQWSLPFLMSVTLELCD